MDHKETPKSDPQAATTVPPETEESLEEQPQDHAPQAPPKPTGKKHHTG
jgi:hypothetical protein